MQQAAFAAAQSCHAPYSHAYAGIALVAGDAIYTGRYAENAAYNPTLPPLQVAINLLRMSGHDTSEVTRAVLCCTRHGGHEAMTRALWNEIGTGELEIVWLD